MSRPCSLSCQDAGHRKIMNSNMIGTSRPTSPVNGSMRVEVLQIRRKPSYCHMQNCHNMIGFERSAVLSTGSDSSMLPIHQRTQHSIDAPCLFSQAQFAASKLRDHASLDQGEGRCINSFNRQVDPSIMHPLIEEKADAINPSMFPSIRQVDPSVHTSLLLRGSCPFWRISTFSRYP